jgi:PAS domain-containing protein
MSLRFKFLLFFSGVVAASVLAGFVWNLRTGLIVFFSSLAGALLGSLFSGGKSEAENAAEHVTTSNSIERKRARAKIDARAGAMLEAMMNGMREGMLVIDEEMRIVASNRAAREMSSDIEGKLETRRLSELTRNPAIHSAFSASLERNEQAETKVELQGPGGPIFDLRVVPLRLDDGNSRGAMGV